MPALPKQLQDQITETNRISEAIALEQSGDSPEENEAPKSESSAVQDVTFDAEPNIVEDHAFVESKDSSTGESSVDVDTAAGEDKEDPNSDTYEQRWKTLQGKYNSEVRKNDELVGRVGGLENMLAQLSAMRDQPQSEPQEESPTTPKPLISASEIEDYGSDLIDVMKRAAKEAVREEMDSLRAENAEMKSLISYTGQKMEMNDRTKLYAVLDGEFNNWREINRNPNFLEWLEQQEVYSGEPRKALLGRAFDTNDSVRVSKFFRGYLDEVAAINQAANPDLPDAPRKSGGNGKVPLESLVAPGAGHSGPADTAKDQGRIWKESDIGAFYEAARRGRFKGREDIYRQTEQEIQVAMTEGKILVGQ